MSSATGMLLTIVVSFATIIFIWVVSFPIGIYSATHQYSLGDYGLTFLGFLGLATPNFLLALVLLYFANVTFGTSIGGLMDPVYLDAPWSWGKVVSVLEHLWIPVIVIGTSGTAGMIRRLRANLLDELHKQYVVTARAKGLAPVKVLWKYPLRMAINPFISDIGNLLPQIVSGRRRGVHRAVAPTTGPMLLDALRSQDMYLAGSFLMFLALLTVVGVFLSDLALAMLDPRIRLEGRGQPMTAERLDHYVSTAPFDPYAVEHMSPEQERYYMASQWRMMWWKLKRHRLAVLSGASWPSCTSRS